MAHLDDDDQPNGRFCPERATRPPSCRDAAGMSPRRTAFAALAAAAALAAVIPPASAADDPPKITAITVHNVRISSDACRDVPVTFRFDPAGWRVDGINAGVWRDGVQGGYLAASPADADATSAKTTIRWCTGSGLGRFTVGPSQITYRNPQGAGTKSADDARTSSFAVRRASRTRLFAHSVSDAGTATVTAQLRAYSLSAGHFTGVRGVTLDLQTRRTGDRWSTVDTAVSGAHGSVDLAGSGKRQWRVASHGTSTVARSVSVTFD